MTNVLNIITKYFWVLFIIGILSGIFIKSSSLVTPYLTYMVIFILFLSYLKININKVFSRIKDFKLITYLILLILIIIPILGYLIFNLFFIYEYSLALLLLLSMPTGMNVPNYTTIFGGDKELSLIIVVISSILSPITIPILIYYLVGIKTNIDLIYMSTTLGIIIFIPLVLSLLIKKFSRKLISTTRKYYSPLSILIVTLIMAGAIAKVNVLEIIKTDNSIIYPFISLFFLAIILHIIGYYSVYKNDIKTKITSSLAIAYMNSTLAIIIASEFFNPKTLFLVILYQIPTNLILIGFLYIIKKQFYSSIKA